ncbi:DNA-binding protein [Shouchella lonarensis]|uniref:DNA-binding protein n=1 Tax=Shouchella lonarensis TaxID=1464122 RepID=UPI00114D4847|nr:DNA-binding protein [Shouchella lonarensis]
MKKATHIGLIGRNLIQLNIEMTKVHPPVTKECFFHVDVQGRIYVGVNHAKGILFSIYDNQSGWTQTEIPIQITYDEIALFQQCKENKYAMVYRGEDGWCLSIHTSTGKMIRSITLPLPLDIICWYLDERDLLWIGMGEESIFGDEGCECDSVYCYSLDGELVFSGIDEDLSDMCAPNICECYAIARKDGLMYVAYYPDLVIAAFDETSIKRVWVLNENSQFDFGYGQLSISREGFWLATDEHALYFVSHHVNEGMKQVKCCDISGKELHIHALKLTEKAIYAHTDTGIYQYELQ